MFDIIVIGAGVIGSLIARKLSSYKCNVLVLDKENDVGNGTSMANSAIVHSGYDPVPGTNKAKFNVLGNKMFPKMCEQLDVSLGKIGSLTIAVNDEQISTLKELAQRAKINGVEVKLLTKEEVIAIEPNITSEVKGALLAPSAMIVNPFTLTLHALENAVDNGVNVCFNEMVKGIKYVDNHFEIQTEKNIYQSRFIINCAGVYADQIHALIEDIDYEINPRKGQYFLLDHFKPGFVRHVLFPLPSEKGKGVLVSPTTSGNYIVGPSSEFTSSKDDVSTDAETLKSVRQQASNLVKNIPFNQTIRVFAGLRPTPSTHDFIIDFAKTNKQFINVSGIESPGLASSPAIAEYVVDNLLKSVFTLVKKDDYNPIVRKRINPKTLSLDERNALIKENNAYGKIICNCEKVSLGELLDELNRSVPPRTIKSIKKRLRMGFGKCQGGFCHPNLIKLLASYYHVDMQDILYDGENTNICCFKK